MKDISIVIPVYNDPEGLRVTLQSLVSQDYDNDKFEIIVCDNNSTDNTIEIAYSFKNIFENIIIVEEKDIQSSYAARNKGVRIAESPIIAFLDSDMTAESNWLKDIIKFFKENENTSYFGCRINIVARYDNLYEFYDKVTGFPAGYYINYRHFALTGGLVVKSYIFDKVGLFDSRLISGGDFEFGNRVHKNGINISFAPHIILNHPARYSLKQILKKNFRIGRGIWQITYFLPEYRNNYFNVINIFKIFKKKKKPIKILFNNEEVKSKKIKVFFFYVNTLKKVAINFGYYYEKIISLKKKIIYKKENQQKII